MTNVMGQGEIQRTDAGMQALVSWRAELTSTSHCNPATSG